MDAFKPLIAKVASGASLTEDEAKSAFELIFAGSVTPAQLGGFLMALRVRGETVAEITGAVARDAARECCGSRRRPGRSTSSAPAATGRGRSIFRRSPR